LFDEVLGKLEPHHQLSDLRPGEGELALLWLGARLETPRAGIQEHPLPTLQFGGGAPAIRRDRVQGLVAEQPQHQLALSLR